MAVEVFEPDVNFGHMELDVAEDGGDETLRDRLLILVLTSTRGSVGLEET